MQFVLTALKFALPALRLLLGQLTLTATQQWLADVILNLINQSVNVASSGGKPKFSASAVPGVTLPPQDEWTEEGIAAWAKSAAPGGSGGPSFGTGA
jgi:hypothetical protein